jgi:hypothetical protein
MCVGPGDGSASDGSTQPNLVMNGTCDVNRAYWIAYQATVTVSTTAHSGPQSCLVCDAGFMDFTMDDNPATVASANPGEVFTASAWVRAAPGATAPTSVYIYMRDSTSRQENVSTFVAVTNTWQQLTMVHTVSTPVQPVEIIIAGQTTTPAANPCFLVDDIEVRRNP